jgi:hypothetical protein
MRSSPVRASGRLVRTGRATGRFQKGVDYGVMAAIARASRRRRTALRSAFTFKQFDGKTSLPIELYCRLGVGSRCAELSSPGNGNRH